ncbi:hypothetical protein HFP57_05800 [Parasphingopyxis algicola]|uniref:hypothetical protein n=1 Tax=Parasphingopyxis algicola TaxID=2026624 RepID=UPI0015A2FC8A|nr:hypothetical protein [Parasphingopyxis algicola]QLC24587.1 hypothetical protein HFP57_05800 [Parasphingopyxis algicola]
MNDTMLFVLQWYGAGAGAVAALIVSLNLGAQKTGFGFIIFVSSSLALIAWAFMGQQGLAIGIQNIVLLVINCIGVYRYLIAHEEPKEAAS